MNRANQPVLQADNLSKFFREGDSKLSVLNGVSLTLARGDQLAITGTSGSGKSTLLNLLAGLDKPSAGSVALCGVNLAHQREKALCQLRNKLLGFVFQFHHLLPEFTAMENTAIPLLLAGSSSSIAEKKAKELLQHVGLGDRLKHKPGQLSGGERQRVAIARALVTEPRLVMADEPTGNLDEQTAESVQQLLFQLNRDLGTAILIVTHDKEFASRCSNQVYLHDGELITT